MFTEEKNGCRGLSVKKSEMRGCIKSSPVLFHSLQILSLLAHVNVNTELVGVMVKKSLQELTDRLINQVSGIRLITETRELFTS